MKKISVLALLLSAHCLAESPGKSATFEGSQKVSNQKFNELTIKGDGDLNTIEAHNVIVYGHTLADHLKVKKLSSRGPLSLSNSQLTEVAVNGPAEIAGSTLLGNVAIAGPALTYSSKFKGLVRVEGSIECFGSAFEKILTIGGQDSHFEEVAIKKIKILKPTGSTSRAQTITLKGVDVSYIEFEAGNGIVRADQKTTIGKIIGGRVQRS